MCCHFTETCTRIECCVDIPYLGLTLDLFLYFRMSIEYFQSTKYRRLNALSLYGDVYWYRMLCRYTISRTNTEAFLLTESL